MPKFKSGDKIRCVDASGCGLSRETGEPLLVKDGVYTAKKSRPNCVGFVVLEENDNTWWDWRFVLISKSSPKSPPKSGKLMV